MERLPDWEERFAGYLDETRDMAYAYGQHDCLLDCGRCVAAITGVDHFSAHVGKYRTPAGAIRHLRSMGFTSAEALLDSLFEEKPIGFAQRGDIVLARDADIFGHGDGVPGICVGGEALFIADAGRHLLARHAWTKAWAV